MKVFTYYMPVPGLWSDESQQKLIEVWARSWKKAGWEPVVLNEDSVKTHPNFAYYKEKLWALPTEYGHDYEGACFLRWLAVAHAGGGMMVDYDVINYGFTPADACTENRMTIYADSDPPQIFTGVVMGRQHHFQEISDIFAAWVPDDHDLNLNSKTYQGHHCSDLTMMIRMFGGMQTKPDWLVRCDGCAQFPHPTWKTSKLVHYTYAMHDAGFWPKYEHIEKIRPFE
jgi:hypothetical protein